MLVGESAISPTGVLFCSREYVRSSAAGEVGEGFRRRGGSSHLGAAGGSRAVALRLQGTSAAPGGLVETKTGSSPGFLTQRV